MRDERNQFWSQVYLLKAEVIVNRDISKFNGRNLIIGCGNSENIRCYLKHPKEDFYSIDIDSKVFPDLCFDITKEVPLSLIPDKRFDFIYFEYIDFTCFIDKKNHPKTETFKNVNRLLSENGICAIATAPIAFIPLGKYKCIKYKGIFFSSTILCEYFCQVGEFTAGRIYECTNSGFDGGLFIIRKGNIDENKAINQLNESAQGILESEFKRASQPKSNFDPVLKKII